MADVAAIAVAIVIAARPLLSLQASLLWPMSPLRLPVLSPNAFAARSASFLS
jgi:hypothetical protein